MIGIILFLLPLRESSHFNLLILADLVVIELREVLSNASQHSFHSVDSGCVLSHVSLFKYILEIFGHQSDILLSLFQTIFDLHLFL